MDFSFGAYYNMQPQGALRPSRLANCDPYPRPSRPQQLCNVPRAANDRHLYQARDHVGPIRNYGRLGGHAHEVVAPQPLRAHLEDRWKAAPYQPTTHGAAANRVHGAALWGLSADVPASRPNPWAPMEDDFLPPLAPRPSDRAASNQWIALSFRQLAHGVDQYVQEAAAFAAYQYDTGYAQPYQADEEYTFSGTTWVAQDAQYQLAYQQPIPYQPDPSYGVPHHHQSYDEYVQAVYQPVYHQAPEAYEAAYGYHYTDQLDTANVYCEQAEVAYSEPEALYDPFAWVPQTVESQVPPPQPEFVSCFDPEDEVVPPSQTAPRGGLPWPTIEYGNVTFTVTDMLGSGATGCVVRGEHKGRACAIKVVHKAAASAHFFTRANFLREKETLVSVSDEQEGKGHIGAKYLMSLYMSWEDDEKMYFVMVRLAVLSKGA